VTDTEWVVLLIEVGVIAAVALLTWLGVGRR
jgi:hypothetical protein